MMRWAVVLWMMMASESPAAATQDPATATNARIAALARVTLTPGAPETASRLREGLADADPRVRATAARVAHVLSAAPLLPDLRTTIQKETDRDAGRELAWAIADLD